MSSLKMTFSLMSLIFLIALGLVFVPTSVMAHPVTDDNNGTGEDHEGSAIGKVHKHPTVTVMVADADSTTDVIEVIRKDNREASGAITAITDLMIVFDVKLMLDSNVPVVNASDGTAIAAGTFNNSSITAVAYNDKEGAVANGAVAVGSTYTGSALEWTTEVTITLTDDNDTNTTDIQQRDAAIEAGVNVDLKAIADLIRANVIRGDYWNEDLGTPAPYQNLESDTVMVKVVSLVLCQVYLDECIENMVS